MGVISEIYEYKETVEVEYDEGRKVKYGFDMVDELELHMRSQYINPREVNIRRLLSLCYRDQDSYITEICFIRLLQEQESVLQ